MSLEFDRLISLLEFTQQSAKLKTSPVSNIVQHKGFSFNEHQIQGLPGIRLNVDEDTWLSIERLHETRPPEVKSIELQPWIEITNGADIEPKLKKSTELFDQLTKNQKQGSFDIPTFTSKTEIAVKNKSTVKLIALEEFEDRELVKSQFNLYLENNWKPWSQEEKQRRKTIRLYAELFTIKQHLEGGIVEAPIELAWGIGIGIWNNSGSTVNYPLLTQLVEVSLNPINAAIELRPRSILPRLELDWYASNDNTGVLDVEKIWKDEIARTNFSFSPFERLSYETLLRTAVTHLDPSGVYWPNEVPVEDRSIPKAGDHLKVTDTWVLFVRPRSNSIFLQDLENLKKAIEQSENVVSLPDAVIAIVTDPSTISSEIDLPSFRGISMNEGSGIFNEKTKKIGDLFFPMPFNDEQVKIVQLLEVFDGVVVQGPPGTGKTHTIANVICHYLANGKRILVTSMKDPALAVLHEKLPDDIKPLAIPLLSSEQEGMRQFEASIKRIASEIQSLDRSLYQRDIHQLEESIDAFHARLAKVGFEVTQWAKRNLEAIKLDGDTVEALDAAKEVVEYSDQFLWFPDKISSEQEFYPQFSDDDIVKLRAARRSIGRDIEYLDCRLPQLADFPATRILLQTHQDLIRFKQLSQEIDTGQVPHIVSTNQDTLAEAQVLVALIGKLVDQRNLIAQSKRSWAPVIFKKLLRKESADIFGLLDKLGNELKECDLARKEFLVRPVVSPSGIENDPELVEAIINLTQGKSPFGISGLFGKTAKKSLLNQISILGDYLDLKTINPNDWQHVQNYLDLQKRLRGLAIRWNALVPELQMDLLPSTEPEHAITAIQQYSLYTQIKYLIALEGDVHQKAVALFPSMSKAVNLIQDSVGLSNLEKSLHHHLTKSRLANVWQVKETCQKTLDNCSGKIVLRILDFLTAMLGNSKCTDEQMQAEWSLLMSELVRVQGLSQSLNVISEVTGKINKSGAPEYANLLRQPMDGSVDKLLPDNWREIWRLKRLATYLESIDAHDNLKRLSKQRSDLESQLTKAYQDVIVKRTWLKLAENANPSIRGALQAYLNAIMKIGKGTGKKAGIHRQAAKTAAAHANTAIPCWIMPHYRVSEAHLGCCHHRSGTGHHAG